MKRFFGILIAILMCACLAACGGEDKPKERERANQDNKTEAAKPTSELTPILTPAPTLRPGEPTPDPMAKLTPIEVLTPTATPTVEPTAEPTPTEAPTPTATPKPEEVEKVPLNERLEKVLTDYGVRPVEVGDWSRFDDIIYRGFDINGKTRTWFRSNDRELLGVIFDEFLDSMFVWEDKDGSAQAVADGTRDYLFGFHEIREDEEKPSSEYISLCCLTMEDAGQAAEIFERIRRDCFEARGSVLTGARYHTKENETKKSILFSYQRVFEDGVKNHAMAIYLVGNDVLLLEARSAELLINGLCEQLLLRSPYGSEAGEEECNAEAVVNKLYTYLLIKPNFREAFDLLYPEDMIEEATKGQLSEFENPPEDFDFYKYMKKEFEEAMLAHSERQYYYKILACEDASDPATVNRLVNGKRSKDSEEYEDYTITEANRPKEADPGSKIYVAYVEWGFSVPDDDDYTEDEVLYVYFHNGRWYVDGKPL